ncbi:hypothetical protein ACJX0J_035330, partial [Zea mays]
FHKPRFPTGWHIMRPMVRHGEARLKPNTTRGTSCLCHAWLCVEFGRGFDLFSDSSLLLPDSPDGAFPWLVAGFSPITISFLALLDGSGSGSNVQRVLGDIPRYAGHILAPSWCDVVAVGGAMEPGGGTAVGAISSLPASVFERAQLSRLQVHRTAVWLAEPAVRMRLMALLVDGCRGLSVGPVNFTHLYSTGSGHPTEIKRQAVKSVNSQIRCVASLLILILWCVTLYKIKWLKCPTGASFGFGGKLVSFHPVAPTQGAQTSTSEVHVHNLVIEQSLASRSTEFEAVIQNGDKSSLRAVSDEERETWGFLRVMFEDGDFARTKLLAHLGFEPPQAPPASSTDELSQILADTLNIDHAAVTDNADAQFLIDNGDDFFKNPQPSEASLAEESVSTNGQHIEQEVSGDAVPSDPSIDKSIQHALVVGDYKGAVNQCLASNRMADALVIAHAGGSALWESTRNHYLKNSISPYLKVVSAMVGNDLMSFVSTWPLSSWKETHVHLWTYPIASQHGRRLGVAPDQ